MDGVATSRDGTPIAWFRSGGGPPLVLVHGTTADHSGRCGLGAALPTPNLRRLVVYEGAPPPPGMTFERSDLVHDAADRLAEVSRPLPRALTSLSAGR